MAPINKEARINKDDYFIFALSSIKSQGLAIATAEPFATDPYTQTGKIFIIDRSQILPVGMKFNFYPSEIAPIGETPAVIDTNRLIYG